MENSSTFKEIRKPYPEQHSGAFRNITQSTENVKRVSNVSQKIQ